jgi:cellulose synthase (UDP-forming)
MPGMTSEKPAPAPARTVQTRSGRWWDTHERLLRCLALLAIGWTSAYLVWRVGWSWHGAHPVAFAALLFCELFGLWSLLTLAWYSWSRPVVRRPPVTARRSVDVYVCTYNEPVSVLRATLTGCARMTYPHTTYLLDDGRRPEMAALADELGAVYLTRPDNAHAKAGNINHALPRTGGELIFILDADQVPMPDALDALVGYFDDPGLALVQTPNDFFNHDSAQHYEPGRHEQSVFYSVLMPGKARHGATYWCGSGAVLRRAALLDIGGVATETVAEDFHTTIAMQRHGWTTRYHAETLVQGLAPQSLDAYLLQRDRWARGNLAVFRTPESPLRVRGLTFRQRLSYLNSLVAYGAGPVRALLLLVLAAALWTGALPLTATSTQFLLLWLPATALSLLAGAALSRGYMRARETFHFELTVAAIHLRALLAVVRRDRPAFRVTPKVATEYGGLTALRRLRLPMLLGAALAAGLVIRAVDGLTALAPDPQHWLAGLSETLRMPDLPPLTGLATLVVPVLAALELWRVLRTVRIHMRRRQVRNTFRFPAQGGVRLTRLLNTAIPTSVARMTDINPSGLSLVQADAVPVGAPVELRFWLPDAAGERREAVVDAEVRSCRRASGGHRLGLRFFSVNAQAEQAIVEYCFVVNTHERLRATMPAIAGPATAQPATAQPAAAQIERVAA